MLEGASGVFERGGRKKPEIDEEQVKELDGTIRELAVANSFFGTKAEALGREVRRGIIEPGPYLSNGQQCELLSIARSSSTTAQRARLNRTSH